ncbi:PepSY-associated TM helix domain-containing protein [Haloechinothrix halophila]|uniref:PepSY-associated TM helix domain-containing protein n=1 Tax=Haloechinothrix halophila TaxID=1069073 RepID=UPI00041DF47A|nr:PepSY domain-containing protein [Haloechinothrix halophila]
MTTTDTTDAPPPSTPEATSGTTSLRPTAALWQLARRVHFLAGLLVAPFLTVLALTGMIYAFTPQINDLLYGDVLYVDEQAESSRPLSEQVDAAVNEHPDAKLSSVIVPEDPERTTQVVLTGLPGLEDTGSRFSSESMTVYVDPYTGEVAGELVTVNNRPPAQVWLRELHGNLNLGDPGRLYSEFVASWLPILVLGGLVLWLRGRRKRTGLRGVVLPTGSGSGRAGVRSWHGALGVWLTVGLLAISVTGLTWSNYAGERVDAVVTALDGKRPRLPAPDVTAAAGAPVSIDRAVAIARSEGLTGELTIQPPSETTAPYEVDESSDGLPIRATSIAIDPYEEKITARQGWEDYPLPAKLTTLGIQAHSGTLLGLANQIAMATLALGALVMLVLGYRMWWLRRPTTRTAAPIPARLLRRLPMRVLVPLVVVTVALGWAMPVFGVTLAGFVLADTAYQAVRRTSAV